MDYQDNGYNQDSYRKKTSSGSMLLIGGGVLAVALLLSSGKNPLPDDAVITDRDYDLLSGSPDKIKSQLSTDNSPVIVTVTSTGWTDEQRLAVVQTITAKYLDVISKIASNMESDIVSIGEGIVLILQQQSGEYKESAIKLYLDMMEQWSNRVSSTAGSVSTAIAKIAQDTGIAVGEANTCTETVFIKSVEETSTEISNDTTTVQIDNRGSAALFGLFKSKRSGKTITTFKEEISTSSRKITYIPHCTQWSLDVVKIDALLANQTMAMLMAYSVLKSVIRTMPDPKYFIK